MLNVIRMRHLYSKRYINYVRQSAHSQKDDLIGNAGRGRDSQDRVRDPGSHLRIPKQSYLSQILTQILLPESKSTQIGNPAWTFVKCLVLAMLQLVSFQSAFIFQTLVLFFMRSCFSRSCQLSQRFIFIQGALFFLYSAFLFLYSAFLILHSAFLKFSV